MTSAPFVTRGRESKVTYFAGSSPRTVIPLDKVCHTGGVLASVTSDAGFRFSPIVQPTPLVFMRLPGIEHFRVPPDVDFALAADAITNVTKL